MAFARQTNLVNPSAKQPPADAIVCFGGQSGDGIDHGFRVEPGRLEQDPLALLALRAFLGIDARTATYAAHESAAAGGAKRAAGCTMGVAAAFDTRAKTGHCFGGALRFAGDGRARGGAHEPPSRRSAGR